MEFEKNYYEKEYSRYNAAYLTKGSPESKTGENADHFIYNDQLGYFGVADSAGYSEEAIAAGKIVKYAAEYHLRGLHQDIPYPKEENVQECLNTIWRSSIYTVEAYSDKFRGNFPTERRWNPTTTITLGQVVHNYATGEKSFPILHAGDSRAYVLYEDGHFERTEDESILYCDLMNKKINQMQAHTISQLVDNLGSLEQLYAFVKPNGEIAYTHGAEEMEQLLNEGAVSIAKYHAVRKYLHNAISDKRVKNTIKDSPTTYNFSLNRAVAIGLFTDGIHDNLREKDIIEHMHRIEKKETPLLILRDMIQESMKAYYKPDWPKKQKDDMTGILISLV